MKRLYIATINEHFELSINNADIEHRIGKTRDAGQNRDLPMLNSSGKKNKKKEYFFYRKFSSHSNKKIE